jgi:hypothetical protein
MAIIDAFNNKAPIVSYTFFASAIVLILGFLCNLSLCLSKNDSEKSDEEIELMED